MLLRTDRAVDVGTGAGVGGADASVAASDIHGTRAQAIAAGLAAQDRDAIRLRTDGLALDRPSPIRLQHKDCERAGVRQMAAPWLVEHARRVHGTTSLSRTSAIQKGHR
jgi:hypothetical protein